MLSIAAAVKIMFLKIKRQTIKKKKKKDVSEERS